MCCRKLWLPPRPSRHLPGGGSPATYFARHSPRLAAGAVWTSPSRTAPPRCATCLSADGCCVGHVGRPPRAPFGARHTSHPPGSIHWTPPGVARHSGAPLPGALLGPALAPLAGTPNGCLSVVLGPPPRGGFGYRRGWTPAPPRPRGGGSSSVPPARPMLGPPDVCRGAGSGPVGDAGVRVPYRPCVRRYSRLYLSVMVVLPGPAPPGPPTDSPHASVRRRGRGRPRPSPAAGRSVRPGVPRRSRSPDPPSPPALRPPGSSRGGSSLAGRGSPPRWVPVPHGG